MIERSLFFLKPPFNNNSHPDLKALILKKSGLALEYKQTVGFAQASLKALYGHVSPEIFGLLCDQLAYRACAICIVSGELAIQKLVLVCGEHTRPGECKPGTIRYDYGFHGVGLAHWNAVHRPTTADEFEKDLVTFGLERFSLTQAA